MLCSNGCGRAPDIELSKNATGFTCAYCVQSQVAPPPPPANSAVSHEEKVARKAAREEKKKAKLEKAKTAVRGRLRGWHKKILFEHEGVFYSYGKVIDDAAVAKLRKELKEREANPPVVKTKMSRSTSPNSANGKGRGWHLKKAFTFGGKFYSFGKEISEKDYKKLLV